MKTTITLFLALIFLEFPKGQSHVTLSYSGKTKKFIRAVKKANDILSNPLFYEKIRQVKSFDNTTLTGIQISELMEKANQEIKITPAFKPIANASTTASDEIKLSVFRFSKYLPTAVNTLIHETVHAVDHLEGDDDDFTHSSNDNSDHEQDNTAPWVIGAIAEAMVEEELKKPNIE